MSHLGFKNGLQMCRGGTQKGRPSPGHSRSVSISKIEVETGLTSVHLFQATACGNDLRLASNPASSWVAYNTFFLLPSKTYSLVKYQKPQGQHVLLIHFPIV